MEYHPLPLQPHSRDQLRVTELFKALSDGTRLALVLQLCQGERHVSALVQTLRLPQSNVSRHLTVLKHADLVRARQVGTTVYYSLSDIHLTQLIVEAFSHAEHERLNLPDHPRTSPGTDALGGQAEPLNKQSH
ncbi:ArsR/SmtB family transcription factor [Deinococcus sp. UYEF24]